MVELLGTSRYEESHAFSSFANWIIPGHLMVGRYPYLEPSRCVIPERGTAQLEQILDSGIRTFICLQEELPNQKEMRQSGLGGFHPYIECCEEITEDEIDAVHFPIVDLSIPDAPKLSTALDDVHQRLVDGEKIYMHCWGGRGRAGLVACCLLTKSFKLSAEESLERISRAFATRQDGGKPIQALNDFNEGPIGNRSPETSQQAEVEKIIERIQHNKVNPMPNFNPLEPLQGVLGLVVLDRDDHIVKSTFEDDEAEKYRALIPDLSYLAKHLVRDLDPQNDLEFYRVRSREYEIMVAACEEYHLIVVQDPSLAQEIE